MAATKKPKNLIAGKTMKKHYKKDGSWKIDKPNPEGYDDVSDYAAEHPEYQFQSTEGGTNPKTGKPFKYTNRYVGIHDPDFAKALGSTSYASIHSGGLVVRVGERKVK